MDHQTSQTPYFLVYLAAPSTQYPLVQRYAWKEIRQTIPTGNILLTEDYNSATKHRHSSIRYQAQSSIQIEDAPLETWNLIHIREGNAPGCSNPLNTIPGRRVLSKAYNVLTAFSITSNFWKATDTVCLTSRSRINSNTTIRLET